MVSNYHFGYLFFQTRSIGILVNYTTMTASLRYSYSVPSHFPFETSFQAGIPCRCPFPAGKFNLPSTAIKLPSVPLPIKSAKVRVTAHLTSDGKPVTCIQLTAKVQKMDWNEFKHFILKRGTSWFKATCPAIHLPNLSIIYCDYHVHANESNDFLAYSVMSRLFPS